MSVLELLAAAARAAERQDLEAFRLLDNTGSGLMMMPDEYKQLTLIMETLENYAYRED